jgi:hypothetical protein
LWMRAFDMSWVVFVIITVEAARHSRSQPLGAPADRSRLTSAVGPARLGAWRPRLGTRA